MRDHDVIIIGGGMAGLTAAIYATRAGFSTLVLEKHTCGGLANWAVTIHNFPSRKAVAGSELMEMVKEQAEGLGAEIREIEAVIRVDLEGATKTVETDEGQYRGRALIIATGRDPIPLPIQVESDHVHYCAICDGAFYQGKHVLVVGGGNSGAGDALYLLNQGVAKITMIEQADRLLAAKACQDALLARPAVTVLTSTAPEAIEVDGANHRVTLRDILTGERQQVEVSGIFVYVGQRPRSEVFRGQIDMDAEGYILGDDSMHTNQAGVFVAGDVRRKKYRQLTTAMHDGTIAALEAEAYLRSLHGGAAS